MSSHGLPSPDPALAETILVEDQPVAAPGNVAPPRKQRALLRYLGKRLLTTLGLLLGATVVSFILVQAVPGDPVSTNLSDAALNDPAAVAAFEARWGLDQPLPAQYFTYLGNLLQGDLGTSQQTGRPVLTDLLDYVPATLEIAVPTLVLSLLIGASLGLIGAVKHNRWQDQGIRVVSLLGLSTPPFWISILALYLFFFILGIAPNGGRLSPEFSPPESITGMYTVDALLAGNIPLFWDAARHTMLPVAVLTLTTVAMLTRFVRSAILVVLRKDYITAAHAKGLSGGTVLIKYLLRAGLVPIITVIGISFASLLSGTVLVESIFSWPGLGQYAYMSATALDRPAILGVTLFVATVYLIINLIVDLLYGLADPRVRLT